jgi:hypothetical protein
MAKKKISDDAKYYIQGTLIAMCLGLPLVCLIELMPLPIKIGKYIHFYTQIYTSLDMSTNYLDFTKLILYMISLTFGFVFINVVNLKNVRRNVLEGARGGYLDLKYILWISIMLFFFAVNFNFTSKYDYDNLCPQNSYIPNECIQFKVDGTLFQQLQDSIAIALDDLFNSPTKCRFPSYWERVLSNYLGFIIPFILGLNFTHLDGLPIIGDITLDWEAMKNWKWPTWVVFLSLVGLILFILCQHLYIWYIASTFRLAFYIISLVLMLIYAKVRSKTKHFHLHHYMLMIILIPFLGVHQNLDLVLIGILSGIMIEGACKWGCGTCWE